MSITSTCRFDIPDVSSAFFQYLAQRLMRSETQTDILSDVILYSYEYDIDLPLDSSKIQKYGSIVSEYKSFVDQGYNGTEFQFIVLRALQQACLVALDTMLA